MNSKLLILLLISSSSLAACMHWGPERYEEKTRQHLDSQIPIGMSFDEFEQRFPLATLVDGEVGDGAFFVSVNGVCFRCTDSDSFKRSINTYARIAIFENGQLTEIKPVSAGGAQ
jgi:hypothetical protein